ncbi:MAG: SMI1/KNR4 family protein, partial [Alphaproteobacteria bacterium]|nr:SMI1/KNR4 family protein [Alphaproteobacteria bacterium]
MKMTEELRKLEDTLRTQAPEVLSCSRAGLSEDELRQLEEHLGFPLPTQIRDLWSWRDGFVKPPDGMIHAQYILPDLEFLSSEKALRRYRQFEAFRMKALSPPFAAIEGSSAYLSCANGSRIEDAAAES